MASNSALQTDDQLLEQMKAYRVSGSQLNQHAQSIAEQFGISGDVEVFVSRSKLINAQMRDTIHLFIDIKQISLATPLRLWRSEEQSWKSLYRFFTRNRCFAPRYCKPD